ncbi:hypothetical protein PCE1_000532 [Barthelona sp. PCE]
MLFFCIFSTARAEFNIYGTSNYTLEQGVKLYLDLRPETYIYCRIDVFEQESLVIETNLTHLQIFASQKNEWPSLADHQFSGVGILSIDSIDLRPGTVYLAVFSDVLEFNTHHFFIRGFSNMKLLNYINHTVSFTSGVTKFFFSSYCQNSGVPMLLGNVRSGKLENVEIFLSYDNPRPSVDHHTHTFTSFPVRISNPPLGFVFVAVTFDTTLEMHLKFNLFRSISLIDSHSLELTLIYGCKNLVDYNIDLLSNTLSFLVFNNTRIDFSSNEFLGEFYYVNSDFSNVNHTNRKSILRENEILQFHTSSFSRSENILQVVLSTNRFMSFDTHLIYRIFATQTLLKLHTHRFGVYTINNQRSFIGSVWIGDHADHIVITNPFPRGVELCLELDYGEGCVLTDPDLIIYPIQAELDGYFTFFVRVIVEGVDNVELTIGRLQPLSFGIVSEISIPENNLRWFYFDVTEDRDVNYYVSVLLEVDDGNPAMYLSSNGTVPHSRCYDWFSDAPDDANEYISVHSNDPMYQKGRWYIGIFAKTDVIGRLVTYTSLNTALLPGVIVRGSLKRIEHKFTYRFDSVVPRSVSLFLTGSDRVRLRACVGSSCPFNQGFTMKANKTLVIRPVTKETSKNDQTLTVVINLPTLTHLYMDRFTLLLLEVYELVLDSVETKKLNFGNKVVFSFFETNDDVDLVIRVYCKSGSAKLSVSMHAVPYHYARDVYVVDSVDHDHIAISMRATDEDFIPGTLFILAEGTSQRSSDIGITIQRNLLLTPSDAVHGSLTCNEANYFTIRLQLNYEDFALDLIRIQTNSELTNFGNVKLYASINNTKPGPRLGDHQWVAIPQSENVQTLSLSSDDIGSDVSLLYLTVYGESPVKYRLSYRVVSNNDSFTRFLLFTLILLFISILVYFTIKKCDKSRNSVGFTRFRDKKRVFKVVRTQF